MARELDKLVSEAVSLADGAYPVSSHMALVTRMTQVVKAAFRLGRREDGKLAKSIVSSIYFTSDPETGERCYDIWQLEPGDCQRILAGIAEMVPRDLWPAPFHGEREHDAAVT